MLNVGCICPLRLRHTVDNFFSLKPMHFVKQITSFLLFDHGSPTKTKHLDTTNEIVISAIYRTSMRKVFRGELQHKSCAR